MNGDIGIIQDFLFTNGEINGLIVKFDSGLVNYVNDELEDLKLAYAISIHKSQGSEYRAVVLSAWNASPYLLSRSILYTAITRAKELLVIAGRAETVYTMVQNAKTGRRYTGLKLRLQQKEG